MQLSPYFDMHAAMAGGALIALGSILFLVFLGKIMGISGIWAEAVAMSQSLGNSYIFIGSVICTAFVATQHFGLTPFGTERPKELSYLAVVLGGFLVGFGAKLGNGCTSGHGVCGLGRLSTRSLCAVVVFLPVAVVVASFVHSHEAVFHSLHVSSINSPIHFALPAYATTGIFVAAGLLIAVGAVMVFLEPNSKSGVAEVIITIVTGAVFSMGLMTSRMSDHHKVLDFLIAQPLLSDATSAFPFPLSVPTHGATASGSPTLTRSLLSQISSGWDASLLFTLGTVVCINVVVFAAAKHFMSAPVFGNAFPPLRLGITMQLIIGAAIFGAGWGMGGVCPGPGLVGLASGKVFFVVWCASCVAGFHAFMGYDRFMHIWHKQHAPKDIKTH